MRKPISCFLVLSLLPVLLSCSSGPVRSAASTGEDPYLWLEEIQGAEPLAWVKKQNEATLAALTADPRYPAIEAELRKIAEAKDRIPFPSLAGKWVLNFWQDGLHPKGIWRRQLLEDFGKKDAAWETLLDLDEMSRKDGFTWVWKGYSCLPGWRRCLLTLSPGGKDASVVREFDIEAKAFVPGGFELPQAKSRVAWFDENTLIVGTDFGPGSMTDSGYPRIAKLWKRGQPLEKAETIYEGQQADMSVDGFTSFRPEGSTSVMTRVINFYEAQYFLLQRDAAGKAVLKEVPVPRDADFVGEMHGLLLVKLRSPWKVGKRNFPEGSLVSVPAKALTIDQARLVYAPDSRSALSTVAMSRDALYLEILKNVSGEVLRLQYRGGRWQRKQLPSPGFGMMNIAATDPFESRVFLRYESYLVPTTLSYWSGEGAFEPREVFRLPARFDATGMTVKQYEAVSADGTKIPYFLVLPSPDKVKPAGGPAGETMPTLLYAYGGFEISQTPYYIANQGKAWLERGGAFAVANIRGGGEFGPRWHRAALKEARQKCFDDFIAVGEHLIARKVTTAPQLGIMGGSNGGLLVSTVMTQRPDLFNAVVVQVPLTDMLRYHKLLAGASWMAEYGDPEDPAMREVLSKYSPYQNVRAGVKYPRAFIYTSTYDDRVHPGHARKLAARLLEVGAPLYYYENMEGGHSASADLDQRVKRLARDYVYLLRQLADR